MPLSAPFTLLRRLSRKTRRRAASPEGHPKEDSGVKNESFDNVQSLAIDDGTIQGQAGDKQADDSPL